MPDNNGLLSQCSYGTCRQELLQNSPDFTHSLGVVGHLRGGVNSQECLAEDCRMKLHTSGVHGASALIPTLSW